MSRIHDALKRAEKERATGLHSEVGAGAVEVGVPPEVPGDTALPKVAEDIRRPVPQEPAVLPGPLTLETLMARCPVVSWSPDTKKLLYSRSQESRVGSEEFRTLRSRLYQSRETQSLRTVLITSALPQEGKTFVAANLAQTIVRQRERRALLIDADLRWSRLHLSLGTPLSPGLTDYLRGEADEFSVIQRGPQENLFFIPGGKSVSNATELISNGRLKGLLDRLRPIFDWIILDSPPSMAVSDASLLAEFCDGVMLVVASGKTPFDVAQKTREQFRKARLLGVVLNWVRPESTGSVYYYGYYSHVNGDKKGKR